MFEKFNVLLSFPRSGNTWIRYIVEFISKRPTSKAPVKRCGAGFLEKNGVISTDLNLGVDISKKVILIKRHTLTLNWDNWTKDNCRLVLLVRNYKEAILRHASAINKNRDVKEINKHIVEYIHCLSSYDRFAGQKILIYYEDLILKPKQEADRLVAFLGIPKGEHFEKFFDKYEYHKNRCLKYYKPGTMTHGKSSQLGWHTNRATPDIVTKITQDVQSNEKLYNKYLRRYG
jgi:hypothetical protein